MEQRPVLTDLTQGAVEVDRAIGRRDRGEGFGLSRGEQPPDDEGHLSHAEWCSEQKAKEDSPFHLKPKAVIDENGEPDEPPDFNDHELDLRDETLERFERKTTFHRHKASP